MSMRPVMALVWLAAAQASAAAATTEEAGFECLLEPWQVIEIRTPVDGIIGAISANRGGSIKRGQPLVELQSQSERVAVELARLRTKRDGAVVAAPFSDVVVDRMLNVGELAEAGSDRKPVLKVAQIDPMRADAALPAALFGQVRAATKATVRATVGGERYNAVVRSVDRVIDAAGGSFVVLLEVPNPADKVPGGSRCAATIACVTPMPPPRP